MYELEDEKVFLMVDGIKGALICIYFFGLIVVRIMKLRNSEIFWRNKLSTVVKIMFNLLLIAFTLCQMAYAYQLQKKTHEMY